MKRSLFVGTLVAILFVLSSSVPIALSAPAAAPIVTDPRYFAGVNVPWFNYSCDFGCGASNGVSSPTVRAALSDGFRRLKGAGVHTARWWTFEGDPTQITRNASGVPTGLNPTIYADFDAALALADQYDLAYDFVLFSAPTALPGTWLSDAVQRQRLADALAPLFEHYKNNPRILAWEIFNEPEYDIWHNKISAADVQATVKLLASTVHAHTSTAVTIGAATLEGVPLWVGLGLDFYAPHFYDEWTDGLKCARCTDVSAIKAMSGFDGLPIVLGEMDAGRDSDALQRLKDFRAKGYAGAWVWSLFTEKTSDGKRVDLGALAKFIVDPGPGPAAAPLVSTQATSTAVQFAASWVSPTYLVAGQQVTFNQDVRSSLDATILLQFEVYDDQGDRVSQVELDNQTVSAATMAPFSTTLTLPVSLPAGRYTVKTEAFSSDRGTMYASSDWAGTFVVEALPPTPTPVPGPDVPEPGPDDSGGG